MNGGRDDGPAPLPRGVAGRLAFPSDLLVEDFGEEGIVLFRLSDRTPRVLNLSGAVVYRALAGGATVEEAARRLAADFDLTLEDASLDAELLAAGLVVEGLAGSISAPNPIPPVPEDWRDLEEKMETKPQEPAGDRNPPGAGPAEQPPEEAVPSLCRENLVLREEEEGAFLFHPESGELSALNPVGAEVWKLLDGKRTVSGIASALAAEYEEVGPGAVLADVRVFLAELRKMGYVSWD